MNRYKITIEYLGTDFVGWQKQNNGTSVQEVIENAIFALSKEQVLAYASGRTDSAVHALGQVAHFDLTEYYEPYILKASLNHFLKSTPVSIISCEIVDENFHARFSAKRRYYKYIILNRMAPSPIFENRIWHVKKI
jgi:tRNA pseudouridine38-40 synthase